MNKNTPSVDDYINQFSGEALTRLKRMRALVKENAPDAVESVSYGLVGYKLHKKPLLYFGGFEKHIGLYATPNAHESFAQEFSIYKQGKGSVQFPHTLPLPEDLVKRVIKHRVNTISPKN